MIKSQTRNNSTASYLTHLLKGHQSQSSSFHNCLVADGTTGLWQTQKSWVVGSKGKKLLWDPTPDIFAKKIACRTNSRQTTFFLVLRFLFFNFFMFRRKKIPAVISGTNHHLRNLDLDLFCQTLRPWLLFGWKKRSGVLRKHSSTLPGFAQLENTGPITFIKDQKLFNHELLFLQWRRRATVSHWLLAPSRRKEKGPRNERDRDRKDN